MREPFHEGPLPLLLFNVTLVCIDTRTPGAALFAMAKSLQNVKYEKAILLSTSPSAENLKLANALNIDWVTISAIKNIGQYSEFVLSDLAKYIATSYALLIQWDGFVVSPTLWGGDFLNYDYIGSPWYVGKEIDRVGNGGFSLRSRKLLEATASLPYDGVSPEDAVICLKYRDKLENMGIKFPPLSIAQRFGVEQGPFHSAFGFHGIEHFAKVMTQAEIADWLVSAPEVLIMHPHTRKLVKSLTNERYFDVATKLNVRRATMMGWGQDEMLLQLRIWLSRFFNR